MTTRTRRQILRRPPRRGAAMVEFALLSFVLYLIVAAVFTFGRALFAAQVLQQTADVFAHELARTPLPPTATLSDALSSATVQQALFNEADLRVDITPWEQNSGGLTLDEYLASQNAPNGPWPIINRLLAPLMIIDEQADGTTYLWYPGAVQDPTTGHYYVQVLSGNGSGPPLQVPVVESLGDPTVGTDPFALSVANGVTAGGLSGVRLNYAFQSASLSAMTYTVPGTPAPTGIPVGATGVQNTYVQAPPGEALDIGPTRGGLYAGPDHLGQQVVGGMIVRPFQRLISAQAVYRREAFSN